MKEIFEWVTYKIFILYCENHAKYTNKLQIDMVILHLNKFLSVPFILGQIPFDDKLNQTFNLNYIWQSEEDFSSIKKTVNLLFHTLDLTSFNKMIHSYKFATNIILEPIWFILFDADVYKSSKKQWVFKEEFLTQIRWFTSSGSAAATATKLIFTDNYLSNFDGFLPNFFTHQAYISTRLINK